MGMITFWVIKKIKIKKNYILVRGKLYKEQPIDVSKYNLLQKFINKNNF